MHPVIAEHGSFERVKLGRLPVKTDERTLELAAYLDDAVVLPEIPESIDYTIDVPSWPMYGNDRLGDCTIAAAGHMVQGWTANAATLVTPDDALLEEAYIPGTGTDDTGRVELDVLNYWRKEGIAGHKIEAFARVDPRNLDHVRAAIYLFGGVYTGIALPKCAQSESRWDCTPAQQPDGEPGSWGGHAVPYLAYGPTAFSCITWGAPLVLTAEFHQAYCDEAYAVISTDWLNAVGVTPALLDLDQLLADVKAITEK